MYACTVGSFEKHTLYSKSYHNVRWIALLNVTKTERTLYVLSTHQSFPDVAWRVPLCEILSTFYLSTVNAHPGTSTWLEIITWRSLPLH